jgi:hypothetical protein
MEEKNRSQWEARAKNGKNAGEKMAGIPRQKVVYTGYKPNKWDY